MTLKVWEFDLETFASYAEFRGDRWGRNITYGKNKIQNFISLEGVLLSYVYPNLPEMEEEFIKSTLRISLGEPSDDNAVGQ